MTKLAYVIGDDGAAPDAVLVAVAKHLREAGWRLCGTVQFNSSDPHCSGPCDMDVTVLPDGPLIRISQSLGREARGCRLDQQALENAVGLTMARLDRGADALLVNKYGKRETEGGGFRAVIAEALGRELPVLLGLNRRNEAAFLEFAGDFAQALEPDPTRLVRWFAAHGTPNRHIAGPQDGVSRAFCLFS